MFKRLFSQFGLLFIILTVASCLRFVNIENNPPSLYGDEVTLLADTYSILKTGHDQTGKFLPLTFELGDYRSGGYIYFSTPFVALFGPTALGIRFLSVLSGMGIVLAMYLITRHLLGEKIGLLSAFLMAVSPWDISLSRAAFESHFGLLLALFGVYGFIKSLKSEKWLYVSAICFALTFHTYSIYKLLTPLILCILIVFFWVELKRLTTQSKIIASVIFLIGVLILLSQVVFANSETRLLNQNFLSNDVLKNQIIQKVNEERGLSSNSTKVFFHNSYVEYGAVILNSYIKNLSAEFLFIQGDQNPRHNPATMGGLYYIQILFLILGIISLSIKRKFKVLGLLFAWIMIAPLGAVFLLDQHALRNSLLLPPLTILSAVGLYFLFEIKNLKLRVGLVTAAALVFVFQLAFFLERMYFISPDKFAMFWAYPAKYATQIALENKEKYKFIIISDSVDSIDYAFPLYAKIEPYPTALDNQKDAILGQYKFKQYENIFIGSIPPENIDQLINSLDGNVLFIGPFALNARLEGIAIKQSGKVKNVLVTKEKP